MIYRFLYLKHNYGEEYRPKDNDVFRLSKIARGHD